MGDKKVAALKERFERDGYVEFRVRAWKVVLHLTLFATIASTFAVWAYAWGLPLGLIPAVFVPYMLLTVGAKLAEELLGAGPALRVDRQGLTLRRWRQPMVLDWADVLGVLPFRDSSLSGPFVAIALPPSVWNAYLAARPARLKWVDRLTHYRRLKFLIPFKLLDVSARSLTRWLVMEEIDRLTSVPTAPSLVLQPGLEGHGPLWLRSGVEVPVGDLGVSDSLAQALLTWNAGLEEQSEGEPPDEAERAAYVAQGRSLAVHLQHELGADSEVRLFVDSPD